MGDDGYRNRQRAEGFGVDAARYDRARPAYPPALVDDVLDGAGGQPGDVSVLDVGCGTGIAGRLFSARGCSVLGVEPDDRMAAVARGHGLAVDVATFEYWEPQGRSFDVVISAQAWHWVDPQAGPARVAAVLPSGGRLALFWNAARPDAAAGAALDAVYRDLAPDLTYLRDSQPPESHGEPIAASDDFGAPVVTRYTWSRRYTTDEWLDLLGTHSNHRVLPPEKLRGLLAGVGAAVDALGGFFTVAYDTTLITARRR